MTDPRTAPTVKTQVGRYYKERTGKVRGPIKASRNHFYPRRSTADELSWTRDGQYKPHDHDLIEEVNADGSPIATTSAPGPADPFESLRDYAETLGLYLSRVEAMTQTGARVKAEWPE